jgi:hypothetical protein
MHFIELRDGLSVSIEEIEAIQRVDDGSSRVFTQNNTYDSTFPYMTLLELVEREQVPEEKEQVTNILKEIGTFAG